MTHSPTPIDLLKKLAVAAGEEIMKFYERDLEIIAKDDDSPLTMADLASNKIILSGLKASGVPIISEENKYAPYEERSSWRRFWLVDPLDGTKEFLKKNGEFTVNIALCEMGFPVIGIIYLPVTRELYYGNSESKIAYKEIYAGETVTEHWQLPLAQGSREEARVIGSRSHGSAETENFIDQLHKIYRQVHCLTAGSSLKFCRVAEGNADYYPRFGPTMEWDTAAGHAICAAMGYEVIDAGSGLPLRYNKKSLRNPNFIVRKK